MVEPRTRRAMASTASKSPWLAIGKPGLDHVDAEPRELLGDLELLAHVERDAGRLLTVAQGGVEDLHVLGHGWLSLVGSQGCGAEGDPGNEKPPRP